MTERSKDSNVAVLRGLEKKLKLEGKWKKQYWHFKKDQLLQKVLKIAR